MGNFLKKAFQDMADSAKAQHEVDKAQIAAAAERTAAANARYTAAKK